MKVADGRGLHVKEAAKKNKKAVHNWFKKHPNSTAKQCADGLGLSQVTVSKYIKEILGV